MNNSAERFHPCAARSSLLLASVEGDLLTWGIQEAGLNHLSFGAALQWLQQFLDAWCQTGNHWKAIKALYGRSTVAKASHTQWALVDPVIHQGFALRRVAQVLKLPRWHPESPSGSSSYVLKHGKNRLSTAARREVH